MFLRIVKESISISNPLWVVKTYIYIDNDYQLIINKILDWLNTEGTEIMCDFKKINQWRLNQETSKSQLGFHKNK